MHHCLYTYTYLTDAVQLQSLFVGEGLFRSGQFILWAPVQ